MRINSINSHIKFTASTQNNTNKKNDNPISKKGETALLIKGTFVAGLGLGARLLFEIMDSNFVIDELGKKAKKMNKHNKGNIISGLGIWAGLIMVAVGGFATLYTLFMAPKIKYNAKVNTVKKSKDMDVYIKGNEAEREIYTQMNEKAKSADESEKAKLKEQYLQMQMAKNRVPDFVKIKR